MAARKDIELALNLLRREGGRMSYIQLKGALEQANYTTSQANGILRSVESYCEIQGAGALRNFILSQERFDHFKSLNELDIQKSAEVMSTEPKGKTLLPDSNLDFVFPEYDTPEEELDAILEKLDPNMRKFDLIMTQSAIRSIQQSTRSDRPFNLIKAIAHNPGIAAMHLERELGISMSSIRGHLKKLELKDLIVWHREKGAHYKGRVFLKNRKP